MEPRLPRKTTGAAATKDEPIRYRGLDVHRSTVVPSVRDEQGKVVMKATVATEEKAIVALVKGAGRGGSG